MTENLADLGREALADVDEEPNEEATETEVEVEIETSQIEDPEPTPEEAEEIRAQKKARIAQVMSKGMLNEKLKSVFDAFVPEGYSGKFVRYSEESVIRYQNLGFGFTYSKEVDKDSVHGSAEGFVKVGDVILMTITLEDLSILHEVKMETIQRNLNKGREEYKRLAEEHVERGGPKPIDLTGSM